jgi:DNA-binding CsgD family transcriptional regulator
LVLAPNFAAMTGVHAGVYAEVGGCPQGQWCAGRADKNGLVIDAPAMSVTALATQTQAEADVVVPRHAGSGYAVSEGTPPDRDRAMSAPVPPEPLSGFRPALWRRRTFQPMSLLGRRDERRVIDGLLEAVRAGRSGSLVLRGAPGIGKTALLEYAVRAASDLEVVRAVGTETETQMPFAALHQLCGPLLHRLERLPCPQHEALATTFGLSSGPAPDPFLVGLAVLSLLSETAAESPLLCVVDDARWLDRESRQIFGFVARRLSGEPVVMLFGARRPGEELRGLREMTVRALRDDDARRLLRSVIKWPLDDRARDQIVAEARGNPSALLELQQGLSPAQLAGGFGLPGALALDGLIDEHFAPRLEALPSDTRRLLLVAAAEPTGDPGVMLRAGDRLGIARSTLRPAENAGLLEVGARVRFCHPVARATVYHAASPEARREAHQALAEAMNGEAEPDRRAWHRAAAAAAPDEELAGALEDAAERAQTRGGLAAAAAFLEQSTKLTPEPARRGRRALAAAHAQLQSGAPEAALALLGTAEAGSNDPHTCARADLLRAQAACAMRLGGDAPALLLEAARQLERVDIALARDTYLEAIAAAQLAGPSEGDGGPLKVAAAARAASPPVGPARPADLLLDGLAMWITEGCASGAPLVKRALKAFRREETAGEEALQSLALASRIAGDGLWDHGTWEALVNCHARLVREAGALSLLPIALTARVHVLLFAGELNAAASLGDELRSLAETTGGELAPYAALGITAWRGQEAETRALMEATTEEAVPRGEGSRLPATHWAAAVLYNGLARYDDALIAAKRASRPPEAMGYAHWTLAELIEAAVRTGERETAEDALAALAQTTGPSGTDWAVGIEARSRALLSDGQDAEQLYRQAIDRLGRGGIRAELARAHLLYGEWLRRERRRLEAREQLQVAHDMLSSMGADAFAARAARELLATGAHARKRGSDTRDDLTAQEHTIAQLARDGLSNPEIASRLFISPRTVEYHLHKVFNKLEITCRQELGRALPVAAAAG